METVLMYGSTLRYPAIRHEVPLEIMDELLFAARDGESFILTSSLESKRIADIRPEARQLLLDDLGYFELVRDGVPRAEAELATIIRALRTWGIEEVVVAPDLPVAVADAVRAAGIGLEVDGSTVELRRRAKSPVELDGIRRAQRAAEAGMSAGEALIRRADPVDGLLLLGGEPLTAEAVREAIRAACADAGAPAPANIMVTSVHSSGGHDPGSGPLPADLPIEIDLWPRDERSGCWTDMTRTFVGGTVSADVARLRDIVRAATEAATSCARLRDIVRAAARAASVAARPGVTGRALYDAAADIIEAAGYPTQRTRAPGETLTRGFYFSLGHGVGLEVHEAPMLGLSGTEPLIAGDVIAIEPGIEGIDGIGGVRYEDLLLITDDGCETLTRYSYEL